MIEMIALFVRMQIEAAVKEAILSCANYTTIGIMEDTTIHAYVDGTWIEL